MCVWQDRKLQFNQWVMWKESFTQNFLQTLSVSGIVYRDYGRGRKNLKRRCIWCKFLKIYLIYLKRRVQKNRARQTEISLTYSQTNHGQQGWARLQARARNSIQVSYVGSGEPSTSAILCCFPTCFDRELEGNQSNQGLNQCYDLGCWRFSTLCHDVSSYRVLRVGTK